MLKGICEDGIVTAYGIYRHREETYVRFTEEEVAGEDMLRELCLANPLLGG